jgi:ABC-type multidrug transport system permease subunit
VKRSWKTIQQRIAKKKSFASDNLKFEANDAELRKCTMRKCSSSTQSTSMLGENFIRKIFFSAR